MTVPLLALFSAVALLRADTSTSNDYIDRYREINGLAPLPEQIAAVTNFVLRRGGAEIVLSQGTLYLLSPVGGRTVGAVFRGAGRITLHPPHPAEQEALRRLVGSAALNDSVDEVILIFSDSTANQLRSLTFAAGDVPGDVRGDVRDFIGSLRGRKDNTFNASVLRSLLNDESDGFFMAHVRRVHGTPLILQIDPAIVESVQLLKPASGLIRFTNWSLVTQFAPTGSPGEAPMYFRQRVATPRYQIETWLKPTPGMDLDFSAVARVTLAAREPTGPWLYFGLHPRLLIDSARWGDGTVAATFKAKDDDDLWVRAPRRLMPGDTMVLSVSYHGNLIDRYDNFFYIDPGADWFPSNRQGDDAALYDLSFHSPGWYPIASVGARTDSSLAGKVMTTRWVTKLPSPSATFNLGLFKVSHVQFEGAPALDVMMSEEAHRAFRNQMEAAGYIVTAQPRMSETVAADVSNSLKWFTNAFGPPLFDHFYVTEIPYFEGVSFPGLIDLSWTTFQYTRLDGFDEFFRAHEVAHQWWFNGVRPATYRDVWLSEGIATFCGLWYLQGVRKGNKEYFRFLDEYFRNIKDLKDRTGATWLGYRNASREADYGYQALIYEKGAWVMHMLRMLMLDLNTAKDDRFSAMMRDFHDTFAGASATTDDFRAVVEKHVGMPMDWFFDQWVKGNAIPTYHVAWTNETTPEGRSRVRLRVTQENVPPEFQAWVLVSADLGQSRFANFRIKVSGAQTEYTGPLLPNAAKSITFNELHSVLADVKMESW
ncbi:MAG TPA: M1 family aminopeptidase [Gemmatimonadales bacterium]|nr:M1 family aminopeptidase [Gemmatimonadales bacterium]